MATYKYLNTNRVNSALKRYGVTVHRATDGFYLADIKTNTPVAGPLVKEGQNITKLHQFTMNEWRTAGAAIGSRVNTEATKTAEEAVEELLNA